MKDIIRGIKIKLLKLWSKDFRKAIDNNVIDSDRLFRKK